MSRTPSVPDGAALLGSAVRRRIVETLASLPRLAVEGRPTRDSGLTAAELGAELELHSTTVRFHLDQMAEAGLVDSHFVRGGGAGRPKKKYVVVDEEPAPVVRSSTTGPYQVLAGLLAEAIDPAQADRLTPEEAGAEWIRQRLSERGGTPDAEPAVTLGQWLGKIGGLVDLLEEWGYTPDLAVDGAVGDVTLTLRECPFLELARTHPAVVCGVHRGLLKGALEVAGERQADVSLRPFVGPSVCHALIVRDGSVTDAGIDLPDGTRVSPDEHTTSPLPLTTSDTEALNRSTHE